MNYYIIDIVNNGAEYNYGVVTNNKNIKFLKQAISNNIVSDCIFIENESLCIQDIDLLYNCYGPEVNDSKITLLKYDKNFNNEIDIINEDININDTEINVFIEKEPYLDYNDKLKYNKNSLIWGNQKVEKRIHFPIQLKLKKDIDLSNLFIGTLNTDETGWNEEIIMDAYYISKRNQTKLLKSHLKENYDKDDELIDNISDIYYEKPELLEKFICDIGDIQGKGEYENNYNIIKDINEEILYEDDEY